MRGGTDFPIQNLPFAAFRRAGTRETVPRRRGHRRPGAGPGRAARAGALTGVAAQALGRVHGAGAERLDGPGRAATSALRAALLAGAARGSRQATQVLGALLVPQEAVEYPRWQPTSATTPTSIPRSITRPPSGACCGRTIRCCPTTGGCPSPITGAPPRCGSRGSASAARTARCCPRAWHSRSSDRRGGWTMSSSWVRSSVPATSSARAVPLAQAEEHVFGLCLLNDWSARDVQALGVPAAGPVPGQELRHHDLAVGRDARGAGAIPRSRHAGRPQSPRHCAISMRKLNRTSGAIEITLEAWLETPRCARRVAAAAPVAVELPRRLLDARADACAPHRERLQPQARAT